MNNSIYQHEVIIHAEHFVDDINPEIDTQAIEGLWMQSNCKLRYQSGTSRALFSTYLAAFQWHYSHKTHVFGKFLKLLSDSYHIRIDQAQYCTSVSRVSHFSGLGLGP